MSGKRRDPASRFWPKVDRSNPDGCWLWTANFGSSKYGLFWDGDRMMNAHKFSFELVHGPVPSGLELDHIVCDTPACVNPAHMQISTHADNMFRTRRTRCPQGHPYDNTNTYHRPDGKGRGCLSCRNS